jgi:hypothetical protein
LKHFELSIICKSCRNGLHDFCSSRKQHNGNLILIKCTCQECENQYGKRQVAVEHMPGLSTDQKNEEITRMFSIAPKLDDDIQNSKWDSES